MKGWSRQQQAGIGAASPGMPAPAPTGAACNHHFGDNCHGQHVLPRAGDGGDGPRTLGLTPVVIGRVLRLFPGPLGVVSQRLGVGPECGWHAGTAVARQRWQQQQRRQCRELCLLAPCLGSEPLVPGSLLSIVPGLQNGIVCVGGGGMASAANSCDLYVPLPHTAAQSCQHACCACQLGTHLLGLVLRGLPLALGCCLGLRLAEQERRAGTSGGACLAAEEREAAARAAQRRGLHLQLQQQLGHTSTAPAQPGPRSAATLMPPCRTP